MQTSLLVIKPNHKATAQRRAQLSAQHTVRCRLLSSPPP